ncbi:MAG: hypothetical protein J6334_10235, partial [Kiritimatiellae bacterium]|nr:hypothetical protein [Kiritimatiellia bacterium]
MTLLRLFRRDCAYHRNRLLALGAAAALIAAILTGALLIGDSVRGTLHDRVNRNAALLTDRLLFPFPVPTALTGGVLHAEGLLRNEELKMKNEKWRPASSDIEADRHGRNDGAEATVDTKPPYDPTTALPHHRTTVLPHHLSIHLYSLASLDLPGRDALASPALARRLNLKPGDRLSVQLATRPVIASESLMGRPPKLKQLQLLFRGVCTNAYAELSFGNPQEEALNLFVPHTLLAETLDLPPGAVNEIWQRDPVEPDDETLWALSQLVLETWNGSPILTSRAFFLPRHLRDHFPEATAGLFSFAQVLSNATDRLDYFFIGAFERGPYAVERDTAALSASLPGNFTDGATLTLYRTTGYRNITTLSHRFPAIRRIDDSAFPDPLKPAIPGLTDVDDCSLWEAGIPVDFDRVTKADEAYWDRYRSKPKLYLNFDQALALSGFDTCTLLLFPKGYDPARLRREILAALRAGPALYRREAVAETLRAKIDNGVAFAPLFLGLSLFLILSALLVLAMLLRLHWQDRAGELRLLQTYLPETPRVRRFLTLEILAFLIPGALAGLAAGCALCALQLYLLEHVWNGIVHLERLTFHARTSSFLTAFLATVLTGWVITRCSFRAATERTAPVRLNAPLQTLRQLAARLFLRKLPEHRFCLILLLLGFLGTLGVGGFGIKARGEDGFGRAYVAETALAVIPAHDAPFPEGLFPVRVHEADRADCANLLQAALPTVYGCDLHALTGETDYLPSGGAA